MNIIHGTWIPNGTDGFIQSGGFYLWVETDDPQPPKTESDHPGHLTEKACLDFLRDGLAVRPLVAGQDARLSLSLPTLEGKPLPSPELQAVDVNGAVTLQNWQVTAYPLAKPLKTINDIHFLCCYQVENSRIGSDFLFWYYFSQTLRHMLAKDQYLPLLVARQAAGSIELFRRWQLVSGSYEQLIQSAVTQMPLACSQHYQPESLLRHFAEVAVHELLTEAVGELPQVFTKRVQDDLLETILLHKQTPSPILSAHQLPAGFKHWLQWQQNLTVDGAQSTLQLGLQLLEADAETVDQWRLVFFLSSHKDPSLKVGLADYWADKGNFQGVFQQLSGQSLDQQVLVNLAQAARIYPKLWQGMEGSEPDSVQLDLDEAFGFLKESAWILEDAGFKVTIPAWLTPKGRRRAKIRLRAGGKRPSKSANAESYFSLEAVTDYRYELAIGDEPLSPEEWQQLVDSKAPLVHFRGQWMELDRDKMQEMLAFMQQNETAPDMTVQELLKILAEEEGGFELDVHGSLAQMLAKLSDNSQLEPIANPGKLNAELREYQKRGVSWLRYLENLGLNGCLADDMGLGKTMQVISLLVLEREEGKPAPTLLIAPTSVIGNWQKEIEKFAPHLTSLVHHGSGREQDADAFKQLCLQHDLLVTSYTLARKDSKMLGALNWRRIVLDEAQNIKNPAAAQTKAILKLTADSRLALTGTPVENRLMDLWSIFNFLNPGYLGKQPHFRKTYELPIQRDNDPIQSATLKKLIQPFILRRLKTDKNIIKDLPDKIDNKVYCNLSKEQASLYEVVVKDVVAQLEAADGIQRQGLMLSTLMKLKQICNHPMQFLQDGSAFSPERSHKLERISDMLEEAMGQGDSVLVFTQFTEIGEQLERYLSKTKHYKTHYLHGGTPRNKREQMIGDFQGPESGPGVFILSLKAGGVGITLTAANHVFHFDRWWNPAVENQATDRAFRIGQKKKVFVHKFVTLGTLEERIDQMISDKQKMADNIVGNDESWLTKLDNQAFKELIALNKHSTMED
ncbi:MAG: DEAD/DEAH box helicase [Methyloglobulus sp.]|nr:DEAD/DEAH box helicase [Methyloglobulus sp.]